MAQTYQLSQTMYHTLSTATLLPPCSSFRRKAKCHGVRVMFPSPQLRWTGNNLDLDSLLLKGSHFFVAPETRVVPNSKQRRETTVVHAQALPRSFSFLPGAGPIRDFLFALIGAVCAFLFAGVLARVWCLEERYFRATSAERGTATMPEMGSNQGQKESVEWVNMVIHKVWKVYRRSLQGWLIQLLQPAIDNLGKPHWVKTVKIVELNLDYEPIIMRTVQRRASRRANDLQYHFGLRYAGGARCLLNLKLGRAGLETIIPVGVYDLDVDAELWLKLRLAPVKPYVGTLSLAFVRLPTIKLVLAPFRVVNLFSIPFLNNFLSKLLTVDLPRLLVLPRHITFDFLPQGQNVMDSMEAMEASVESGAMDESIASGVMDLLKTAATEPAVPQDDPSEAFVGELSVTICDARDLPVRGFTGWSNPYCIITLGDQVLESKRNKETSHPSGHKDPIWNQDFLLLVEDPRRQRLMLRVRDSNMTLNPNIGYCQINLAELQDCVPRTLWVKLKRDGPFGPKKVAGRVRIALTYKSYVDEGEEESDETEGSLSPYIKVYGDAGAESVEDIGISLGEAIDASLMEEAERTIDGEMVTTDDETELVSTQREDSSVEVTSSPKASPNKGNARGTNGAAAAAASRRRMGDSPRRRMDDSERVRQGNGAVRGEEEKDLHLNSSSENSFAFSRDFGGDNGDVRVPRGEENGFAGKRAVYGLYEGPGTTDPGAGVLDREFESLSTRPSEALDGLEGLGSHRRKRSSFSDASYSKAREATPAVDHTAFLTHPDHKDEDVRFDNGAELGAKETVSDLTSNSEVNKLLWLCMFTTVAFIIGCSLHLSNPLHP